MKKNLIIKEEKNEELANIYAQVDVETSNTMKQALATMGIAKQKTKFVMGEQLAKVQNQLAGNNQYNGFFGKWYSVIGLKSDFVYDCINYYQLLVANPDNQMIQNLQFSKVCEVAKLKDSPDLQKKVIEIAPIKEMRVKEIKNLVNEVKEKKELTEEMIEDVREKKISQRQVLRILLK